LVVEEREAVISEISRLRDGLVRSAASCLTELEHRLKLALSSYGLRRPSDTLLQYEQQLDDMRERMLELQTRRLDDLQNKAAVARNKLFMLRPDRVIATLSDRVASAGRMLRERALNALSGRQAALAALAAKLDSLSPLAVLARGYSITYRMATGDILRDSSETRAGDRVSVKLHRGSIACSVEKVED
jgi:exodeoxyribonuclease VII large subunit